METNLGNGSAIRTQTFIVAVSHGIVLCSFCERSESFLLYLYLWKYVEKVILYFNALYIDVIVIQNILLNYIFVNK
jgi:hypothetical protein